MTYNPGSPGGPASDRTYIDNELRRIAGVLNQLTGGLTYVESVTPAGAPAVTPTVVSGRAPLIWNETDLRLYIYSGGAWHVV